MSLCVYFSVVTLYTVLQFYNYIPVLNYFNMFMFYISYFVLCSTSTCFILVQFIKYVICIT